MPGCPPDPAVWRGPINPIAVVLHRTYGFWPGDYSVIRSQGTAHWLIGKDGGQWVQFMDSSVITWHCNGANRMAVGIELTGVNEDVLTDWQVDRTRDVLNWLTSVHGIMRVFLDPYSAPRASVWVNGGGYRGSIGHYNVATDDGSAQHTDLITIADWSRVAGGGTVITPPEDGMEYGTNPQNRNEVWCSDGTFRRHVGPGEWGFKQVFAGAKAVAWDQQWFDSLVDVNLLGLWMQQQAGNVVAAVNRHTDEAVAALPAPGGVAGASAAEIEQIVVDKLNATTLNTT